MIQLSHAALTNVIHIVTLLFTFFQHLTILGNAMHKLFLSSRRFLKGCSVDGLLYKPLRQHTSQIALPMAHALKYSLA